MAGKKRYPGASGVDRRTREENDKKTQKKRDKRREFRRGLKKKKKRIVFHPPPHPKKRKGQCNHPGQKVKKLLLGEGSGLGQYLIKTRGGRKQGEEKGAPSIGEVRRRGGQGMGLTLKLTGGVTKRIRWREEKNFTRTCCHWVGKRKIIFKTKQPPVWEGKRGGNETQPVGGLAPLRRNRRQWNPRRGKMGEKARRVSFKKQNGGESKQKGGGAGIRCQIERE